MQTQAIPLSNLHVSPLNMRAEKKPPSVKRMAEIAANILPTVREKGILTDLIVRPNNDGFEILAGRRRYYAAKVIEKERGVFPPVNCEVWENITDADAREISLIENVAREDADEITCYETFSALIREGRAVAEIARTFGKTERQVTQCLAVANLLPRIRDLYRSEELDAGDLQLLTMATKTQQRDWLGLWNDNDAPTGQSLKGWLFGGAAIQTKVALFDLEQFSGKIVGDLFSEDGFFGSADEFWTAQDEAIAAKRDAYLAAKWSEVVVLERGSHFPQWDFVKAGKKQGGRVYIEPTHTGEVRFHEGYVSQGEAAKAKKKAKAGEAGECENEAEVAHSPITKTMQNYLDLHRHAAVLLAFVALECVKAVSGPSGGPAGTAAFTGTYAPSALVSNLALVHALGVEDQWTWNIPSWSISAEVFAYITFALVCLFARRTWLVTGAAVALSATGAFVVM